MDSLIQFGVNSLGRWQSKRLTNVDQKSLETVFDCHLSPYWRQMSIKNTVSSNFHSHSSIVKSIFDCLLSGVVKLARKLTIKNLNECFKFGVIDLFHKH